MPQRNPQKKKKKEDNAEEALEKILDKSRTSVEAYRKILNSLGTKENNKSK